ncbi:MAG: RHS repeat protein, partial [Planctomycetota bacterium]
MQNQRTRRPRTNQWSGRSSIRAAHPGAGLAASALLLAASSTTPVRADEEILHAFDPSLTTFLAPVSSAGQDARPRAAQRGVGLDGSLRHPAPWPVARAGQPLAEAWGEAGFLADVRLDCGTWSDLAIDLALPAPGFRWVIGRTYNARQQDADGTYRLADGPQGRGWFQVSQPELLLYDDDDDPNTYEPGDVLYLLYGADRYIELRRDGSRRQFIATNGAAGAAVVTPADETTPELICITGQDGWTIWFLGFENAGAAAGRLWRVVDPYEHAAYVGHSTDPAAALAAGYHPDGSIALAFDSAGRRYDYTLDGAGHLVSVAVSVPTGSGQWTETDEVTYRYGGALGGPDDLTQVTVRTRVSDDDPAAAAQWTRCYAYYGAADPDESSRGLIRLVVEPEGVRRWRAQQGPVARAGAPHGDDPDGLVPFASRGFTYDAQRRLRDVWFDGRPQDVWSLDYEENPAFTGAAGYDAATWATRTVVARPDDSYLTQYFDEVGQPLHQAITAGHPDVDADSWVTAVTRDERGQVVSIGTPASVAIYVHDLASWNLQQRPDAGLVWRSERVGPGEGGLQGFLRHSWWQIGATPGAAAQGLLFSVFYATRTLSLGEDQTLSLVHPYVVGLTEYHDEPALVPDERLEEPPPPGAARTTWSAQFTGAAFNLRKLTQVDPVIDASEHGSGVPLSRAWYFDDTGRLQWHRTATGSIHYLGYDEFGRVTLWGEDVETSISGDAIPFPPTGFASSGEPLHRLLRNTYVEPGSGVSGGGVQGSGHQHQPSVTEYKGRRQRRLLTVLADGRIVELHYPDHTPERPDPADPQAPSQPGNYAGPVTCVVRGLDGRVQLTGTIALPDGSTTSRLVDHVDETQHDPLAALAPLGPLAALTTVHFDDSGTRRRAVRVYHDVPSPGEAPLAGEHFDETQFGWDALARPDRTRKPDGTITRRVHDVPGHVIETWIGSDDSGGPADDLVLVEALEYDGGAAGGNGLVTRRTAFIDAAAQESRVTEFAYDARDRLVLVIKMTGAELVKLRYDRLGRLTHHFLLARDDDDPLDYGDVYDPGAAATDVEGDIVLREQQHAWDFAKDDLLLGVVIDRHPTDVGSGSTRGALDANRDEDPLRVSASDLRGRASISTRWFDRQGRILLHASWGTGGTEAGLDLDRRNLAAPIQSGPEVVRTAFTWDDAGRLRDVADPAGRITRYEYDAAAQIVRLVEHLVDGVPDDVADRTIRYEWNAGRLARLVADLPEPAADQVTEYHWGTVRGGGTDDSAVASGRLLREILTPPQDPGQPESQRALRLSYNAQGELVRRADAMGTVVEIDRDEVGREVSRRVVAMDEIALDGAVRRIDFSYTDLGLLQSVAQADGALNGTGTILDELRLVYGAWHRPITLRQDVNGPIDEPGSIDDHQVAWSEMLATPPGGRRALRRTSMTLPGGLLLDFAYDDASAGSWDACAGRVSRIRSGGETLASYRYLGAVAVSGVDLPEIDAAWSVDATPAGPGEPIAAAPGYPALDRFGRLVRDRWRRNTVAGSVALHDVEMLYDVTSNLVGRDDHVALPGFDAEYVVDDFDRLVGSTRGDRAPDDTIMDHDGANAIRWRDETGDGVAEATLVHDLLGRLVDDGVHYRYVYDVFGRLRRVEDREDGRLVVEHRYNGLGWRIAEHSDSDGDGLVEDDPAQDPWRTYVHDDAWRVVAVFVEGEAAPRERFVYHCAGRDGRGGSSYVDALVCRERNLVIEPANPLDPPEERLVYLHDAHGDVVMLLDAWGTAGGWDAEGAAAAGGPVELIRYSAYGEPRAMPAGDLDGDGDLDDDDLAWMLAIEQTGGFDVRADLDGDGDIDAQDRAMAASRIGALARGVLSSPEIDNRRGYAGSTFDPILARWPEATGAGASGGGASGTGAPGSAAAALAGPSMYHVRHRVFHAQLGRWLTRDPLGYVDGLNLHEYVGGRP